MKNRTKSTPKNEIREAVPVEQFGKSPDAEYLSDREFVLRAAATQKVHEGENRLMPVKDFFVAFSQENNATFNPGKRSKDDILPLYKDILINGVHTLCWVCTVDKKPLGLRGYVRAACLDKIRRENPKDFSRLGYDQGIKVFDLGELTLDQATYLARDHNVAPRSDTAIIEQAVAMFQKGSSEKSVIMSLWAELEQVFRPIPASLTAKIRQAQTVSEKTELMVKFRHGAAQFLGALAKVCPRARQAYFNGKQDLEGERLNQSDINALGRVLNKPGVGITSEQYTIALQNALSGTGVSGQEKKWHQPLKPRDACQLAGTIQSAPLRAVIYRVAQGRELDLVALDAIVVQLVKRATGNEKAALDALATQVAQWDAETAEHYAEKKEKAE